MLHHFFFSPLLPHRVLLRHIKRQLKFSSRTLQYLIYRPITGDYSMTSFCFISLSGRGQALEENQGIMRWRNHILGFTVQREWWSFFFFKSFPLPFPFGSFLPFLCVKLMCRSVTSCLWCHFYFCYHTFKKRLKYCFTENNDIHKEMILLIYDL